MPRVGLHQSRRSADRGVRDDHAVDPARAADRDDIVERHQVDVGRDLDQHRSTHGAPIARVDDARDELVERVALLQIAQARRVGRRDVDGEIARDVGERPHAEHIVGYAVDGILVGPDVDAENAAGPAAREPCMSRFIALIVEAQAIDERLVAGQSKQPWARVARLRARRESADLDKAEAGRQQPARDLRILVEPRRQSERVRKGHAEGFDAEARVAGLGGALRQS